MNAARSIILIGMMGAGKSSVGRALERLTGLARFDTDEVVAAHFGMSIAEIFDKHGEERFRDAETNAIRNVATDRPVVITTGGGIVLRPENIDLLKRLGTIVWLNGDEATLFERASRRNTRPLLQNDKPRAVFSELLRKRAPLYQSAADFEIDTSGLDHDQVADIIVRRVEQLATR
ncbi:MAG TPA: shikimate kinase [Chthoniobacterales bacterium]|nr:shikimate kinase [Chthoniobacterales bacterium]